MISHTSLTIVTNQERNSAAPPPQCDGIFIIFKSAMEASHFYSSDDEDALTGKSRRGGCNKTNNMVEQKLDAEAERLLLREIEQSGGISCCSIRAICNRHPDVFGGPRSDLRKAASNKLTHWRKMCEREYKDRVIAAFAARIPRSEGSISDVLISPLPHSPRPRQAELTRYEQAAMIRSPGGIVPYSPPAPRSALQGLPLLANGTSSPEQMYIHDVLSDPTRFVEIEVDIDRPERNREVFILKFHDKNHDGKLYSGFSIQMPADTRDAKDGLFKAFLVGNGQPYVFIQAPGLHATFRRDFATFHNVEKVKCDRIQEALNLNRNDVAKDGKRISQHYLLKFPAYLQLSNTIYSPNSRGGKIKGDSTPYPISFSVGAHLKTSLLSRVVWKVHVVEAVERFVGDRKEEEQTDEDEMAQLLSGISFTCSRTDDDTGASAVGATPPRNFNHREEDKREKRPRDKQVFCDPSESLWKRPLESSDAGLDDFDAAAVGGIDDSAVDCALQAQQLIPTLPLLTTLVDKNDHLRGDANHREEAKREKRPRDKQVFCDPSESLWKRPLESSDAGLDDESSDAGLDDESSDAGQDDESSDAGQDDFDAAAVGGIDDSAFECALQVQQLIPTPRLLTPLLDKNDHPLGDVNHTEREKREKRPRDAKGFLDPSESSWKRPLESSDAGQDDVSV